ncbi:DUF2169 domain-containing protein [Archangium violaceum]|uniref:DUF2169 family type VI secretion system accessory protein n=1 Tax=Archangium violaceum TaxID=83451 RepID=UPI002B3189F7|nr:DUF2169 domain-containing protein [Archangium gephyra]
MQISSNTTGMQSGLCISTDKEARDHCIVVIKGTFLFDTQGEPRLSELQRPLVHADEHHGSPGETSIRHECDFAMFKPRTDVLVHGHAIAPDGRRTERMLVRLELPDRRKDLLITGDRQWDRGLGGLKPTPPRPFLRMPLVYDRAFGGSDHSHPSPEYRGTELRNPVGVGFRKNPHASATAGISLPNIEEPRQPLERWDDKPAPAGFGTIGRNWQPRSTYAGTYDQHWLDEVHPFLPADFDPRYFQSAPEDQQVAYLRGGETIRCLGMSETGAWTVKLPYAQNEVTFRLPNRQVRINPRLDTVLLDTDAREVIMTWRASIPLGKKLTSLREVHIGPPQPRSPSTTPLEYRRGKPYFRGLAALVAWKRQNRWKGLL